MTSMSLHSEGQYGGNACGCPVPLATGPYNIHELVVSSWPHVNTGIMHNYTSHDLTCVV